MDRFLPNQVPIYNVEHLATFSTTSAQHEQITPRMALQRLFKMEKTSGIWTQRMAIQLKANHMWILDGETNDVVERFPVALIQQPNSFNDQNHIYNNILIFTVQLPSEPQGELHIFQCVSHEAVNVVDDIYQWIRHYGVTSGSPSNAPDKLVAPSSNVNVKEAVTVFNQIAAQREKKGASSDSIHRLTSDRVNHQDLDSRSDSSSFAESGNNAGGNRNHEISEGFSNERYVSILNHCFDDIERFIIRLQHAAAAMRELQIRSNKRGAKNGDGLLALRARGPSEDDFLEILSKFKLAFNLLAKLKGCIHDPNAPELVHFLFTPLAIIIEAARSNEPPVDPSLVGVPYLNGEAIELLSNCCTSKEYDLWQSLGINWIQPVKHLRMSSPFQPVFHDGWAPNITEPELIGIGPTSVESEQESDEPHQIRHSMGPGGSNRDPRSGDYAVRPPAHYDDSDDYDDNNLDPRPGLNGPHRGSPSTSHANRLSNVSPSPLESIERESPHDGGLDPEQIDWLVELHSRDAKIVRVLFPRTANNSKELTVVRGEILEILDDSRKWWKARNSRGQVAHVPHTIVGEIEHDALAAAIAAQHHHHRDSSANDDWIRRERQESAKKPKPQANNKLNVTLAASAAIPATAMTVTAEVHRMNSTAVKRTPSHKSQIQEKTFDKELSLSVKERKFVRRGLSVDTFMENFANKSEDSFDSIDLLQLMCHKRFPDSMIDYIERKAEKSNENQFGKLFLQNYLSKQSLKNLFPDNVANDAEIQRLYSNLLVVKNMMTKSSIDPELKDALSRRQEMTEILDS